MPDRSGPDVETYRNRSVAGGLNTLAFPLDIQDDQAVDLTNIDISQPGIRQVRAGMSLVASGMTFGPVLALSPYTPSTFSQELLAISPGATYPDAAHLKLWKWSGSGNWSLVGTLSGMTSSTLPVEMTPGLDFNATGGPAVIRITSKMATDQTYYYNGTNLISGAAQPTTGMFPSTYMLNRAFGAGRAGSSRGKVFYSDVASFCATGMNSTQSLTLGGGSRQEIVALKAFRQQDLIAFLADRTEAIQVVDSPFLTGVAGSGALSTSAGWSRVVIDERIGCGARRSVVTVGEDLFFVDQYGNVRSLARTITDNSQGTKSLPVSAPIQSWIDRINPTAFEAICAEAYDRYYIVGLPIDSATSASHTFVFDRILNSWTGPWIGKWQPYCMTVAALDGASLDADKNPTLFIAGSDVDAGKVYRTFTGTTDAGDAIVYQETSRRIYADQFEADKLFRRMKDYFIASGTATMQIEARKNGESFQTIGYASLEGDLPALPQPLPFTLGGVGVIEKVMTLEDFQGVRDMQFRHTCTTTVDVQHLGYSALIHRKNVDWELS